jgi:hypothetical protein
MSSQRAKSDASGTPRHSSEPLDSGVNTANPGAERGAETPGEARDTELDGAFPPEPVRTPVAGFDRPASLPRPDEDTLLSAPRPADRLELLIEDRLASFESRLDSMESRLEALERRKQPEPAEPSGRWWIWAFFLLALAIAWKALETLK